MMNGALIVLCSYCISALTGPTVGPGGEQLPPVFFPPENPFSEAKRVLGKILFWDEQLSSDNTVACGTCHIPSSAGADPRFARHPGPDGVFHTEDDVVGSMGIVRRDSSNLPIEDSVFGFEPQVTRRAAQSYFMSMYAPDLFWDGRAPSEFVDPRDPTTVVIASGGGLESQAVIPILSTVEMAHEKREWFEVRDKLEVSTPLALATHIPPDVAKALTVRWGYSDLFEIAFGDSEITPVRIALAIATYERTLVPDQTPWDRFMAGDAAALTEQQIEGWNVLQFSTFCLNCHTPPLFTDNKFHNLGLRPAVEDEGRREVTGELADMGRFKTPTLRNVGLKPTLMHVGWIRDVPDAIEFYNAPAVEEADPGWTGHVQFTENQSGIPTPSPGEFIDYNSMQAPIEPSMIDFIVTALTDPRVAQEKFPFDRPTLRTEELAAVASFAACMTGPRSLVPPIGPIGGDTCLNRFDSDGDGDVDLADFRLAQLNVSR